MGNTLDNQQQQVLGAAALELELERFADRLDMSVMRATWSPRLQDSDCTHRRLDFWIDDYSASIYFTRDELVDCGAEGSPCAARERLHALLVSMRTGALDPAPFLNDSASKPLRPH